MIVKFPGWYHPFEDGWKLCSYEKKNEDGSHDDLSTRLLKFKERDSTAITAFTEWSIDKLNSVLPEINIDYCIRALGRSELIAQKTKPLHALAGNISQHFGIEFIPDLIAKNRATQHLVKMNKAQRQAELEGVFYLNKKTIDLSGASILLVDDIRTSGTTCDFIRKAVDEHYCDLTWYLFVLAESNCGANSKEAMDNYLKFAQKK